MPVAAAPPPSVTVAAAARVWARIGWLSFGGPAGQIALMHDELVVRRRWLDEARFLHALNYCMLLPGPEAQQLATYIGWLLHRTRGGLIAGVLFVLPGLLIAAGLATAYCTWRDLTAVAGLLFGLKAAVVAVVAGALVRISQRALRRRLPQALAVAAFGAIAIAGVPFPVIVAGAAAIGALAHGLAPAWLPTAPAADAPEDPATVVAQLAAAGGLGHTRPSTARTARTLAVCLLAWLAPVAALMALAPDSLYRHQAVLFSQAALVTFGGAYAALAYVGQRAVALAWLAPGQMVDALGLAETTPGPLVLVLPFVAFVGAHAVDGLGGGLAAMALAAWVTFAPSFLWIFVGAPYIEALRGHRGLHAALACITAAVVGVIANLSLWFALHTLFAALRPVALGPWTVAVPVWASVDGAAVALTAAALIAGLGLRVRGPWLLLGCALAGLVWRSLG
ncbi:MAG: chromate efflux transporter [Myxococcales bacterium]|nr:chromate efflux transporter [Myxococcales bacterium]